MTVYGLIALVIVLPGMALLLWCVPAAPARDAQRTEETEETEKGWWV